ncbi:MAG: glycosyltransferase [Flavitalea sp.]
MIVFYFIFIAMLIAYAWLINYYHGSWSGIPELKLTGSRSTKVSVIISLRNESTNIASLVASLHQQDYPRSNTEIIMIDDHSTDDTYRLLTEHTEPGYFKVLRLSELIDTANANGSFKKLAISKAIENAGGEMIVTTDADCTFGHSWLTELVDCYETRDAAFIAAPVVFKSKNSFLSVFQNLDFITLQGITGASVFRKFHTMCNGANLAYSKKAFQEVNGFEGIDHIPSGDDMMLMYKIYLRHPDNVYYLKNPGAIVTTEPAKSWKEFLNQRIRWSSKAVHYDDKRIYRVLLLVYALNVSFLVVAIASFWKLNFFLFFLLSLTAKVLIEFPFVNNIAMFFGQQRLMKYFPLMQPFHILYTIVAGWLGKFGSYEWKGRKIVNNGKRIQGT